MMVCRSELLVVLFSAEFDGLGSSELYMYMYTVHYISLSLSLPSRIDRVDCLYVFSAHLHLRLPCVVEGTFKSEN